MSETRHCRSAPWLSVAVVEAASRFYTNSNNAESRKGYCQGPQQRCKSFPSLSVTYLGTEILD